ncbi:hypothetical protein B0H14DRAFT_3751587 [Mycena olivaceomarginata]|nr:hypothetical protein B0H14DRAFT_3751587 [Mycena olivaceomarginata]
MHLLKEETVHSEAVKAYKAEITYFKRLGRKRDPLSKIQSSAALAFLGHLSDYVGEVKWTAYSLAGTIEAARVLGVPVDSLPRTSNHLEGFNGCIKGPMYAAYRHNGHLLRIDVWVHAPITTVIPAFFEKRRSRVVVSNYYSDLRTLKKSKPSSTHSPTSPSSTTSPTLSSSSSSSPSSSSFTSSDSLPPQQHSIPARTPQDQRIEKWLEELINDMDTDSNEDGTGIPTSEEIALMMAKLDPDIDDGLGIEDVPVAEDIMAMECINIGLKIPISVLGKPPSELLTPLPFPPLTLASSHLQTDPIDRVESAVANMSLSSDLDDLSPFYEPNTRLSAVLALSNLPQTADLSADTSFMSDRTFIISPSTSPQPPASPSCRHGSPVLLRLPSLIPTSPSSLSPSSPDHPSFGRLNSIATSMMRLQSAHTEMATELRFLRDTGGAEVLEQLERYMSPSLRDLLETETPSNSLLFSADPGAGPETSETVPTAHPQTIHDVRRPTLERFQLQNREKRKPS